MAAADYRLMTEATGQRIAAALEALHLATVTGVKGDAEQNYRHGDVNITPANIGAVDIAGDTMTGTLTAPNFIGSINGYKWDFFTDNTTDTYTLVLDINNNIQHRVLPSWLNYINTIPVDHGGTGATTPAGARENLHAMQNPDTSAPQYTTGSLNDAPVGISAWYGSGCVNAPFASWMSVLTISIIAGYVQQIAFPWFPWQESNRIAYRVCDNGTWHAWSFIAMS